MIGVDPSLAMTGIAVIDDNQTVIATHAIPTKPDRKVGKTEDLGQRLRLIGNDFRRIYDQYPGVVVIEAQMPSGMGKASLANVGRLMGAYGAVLGACPVRPLLVAPQAVKKRLGAISKEDCWKAARQRGYHWSENLMTGNKKRIEAMMDAVAVVAAAQEDLQRLRNMVEGI